MKIQTTFEQHHGWMASGLSRALELMDSGDQEAAHAIVASVQATAEQQAQVVDARVYGAVRHLCEARQMDSRRFYALQQVLGLREIVRTMMIAPKGMDLIAVHLPIENDFFSTMLGMFPKVDTLTPLANDNTRNWCGTYSNGNARLWDLFVAQQADQEAHQEEEEPA